MPIELKYAGFFVAGIAATLIAMSLVAIKPGVYVGDLGYSGTQTQDGEYTPNPPGAREELVCRLFSGCQLTAPFSQAAEGYRFHFPEVELRAACLSGGGPNYTPPAPEGCGGVRVL